MAQPPAAKSSPPAPARPQGWPRKKVAREWPCDDWSFLKWVVALFVILFFLLGAFPGILNPYANEGVRRKEAMIMAAAIARGIEQFGTEHGQLPLPPGVTAGAGDLDTDTSTPAGLIQILTGREPDYAARQNPGKLDFLEGIKPAKANRKTGYFSKPLPWSNGLVFENDQYSLVDPWGHLYRVRLDTDGDQQVTNPDPSASADGRPKLPHRVIVWSPGKDGKEETREDNPRSWE